jgi:glutamyl-Q tRNA(Asp) synthetase
MISRLAPKTVGRFAPSPTGPLHLGSLVAALGSWLFARSEGGSWLVRMEDLDASREVPGSADDILRTLSRLRLEPDGPVVKQSQRRPLYGEALERLRTLSLVYPCGCSRKDLERVASAPARDDGADTIYPGTCRAGLAPGKSERSIRFRAPSGRVRFEDEVVGACEQDVAAEVGDFVLRRADGYFAYQLAVVVDDAAQGVTQVVRGADLLGSTARQIALGRALALPRLRYAHLPLLVDDAGAKLGKRHGAIPLDGMHEARAREALARALAVLGQEPIEGTPREMLDAALVRFEPARIPREPVRVGGS